MRFLRPAVAAVLVAALAGGAAPAAGSDDAWTWPLAGRAVDRGFEPPPGPYAAGHRGVDLRGTPGEPVLAVAPGTVAFVGEVAGTPVVTVSHGTERSTYQPVRATVEVGRSVDAGQTVGTLLPGHRGCGSSACLHLGRVEGETYLDPSLLLAGRYRLISPDGPPPAPPRTGTGVLALPVDAPVTSAFGLRVHPVTGESRQHDGLDLGAPCGTPVAAAAAGTVRSAGPSGGYGLRVEIDHGGGRVTSYSHLSSAQVAAGGSVAAGQPVARVGITGTSTGCHLHFSVHDHGAAVDPAPLL
ncbi:peptidoglycan DD-metalloendopeptidase family protein [Aeromicrobium sp. Leaf350]|uniref:peptidoglycan DD-metalloendopeptidase family protein n=1 Tax=Aeromicrobium sp. Leaf350 TaxID=2876565 RepID=UPI001E6461D3|nr:peptidoglycan DD-metalloendopeptidase family protein [Aeromicrobium sp. Leaf350]